MAPPANWHRRGGAKDPCAERHVSGVHFWPQTGISFAPPNLPLFEDQKDVTPIREMLLQSLCRSSTQRDSDGVSLQRRDQTLEEYQQSLISLNPRLLRRYP